MATRTNAHQVTPMISQIRPSCQSFDMVDLLGTLRRVTPRMLPVWIFTERVSRQLESPHLSPPSTSPDACSLAKHGVGSPVPVVVPAALWLLGRMRRAIASGG